MNSIPSIVKKNITLLLRSKSSALIIVLGPMLIVLLAGLAFDNTNTYRLNLGAYSGSYSNLSDSFLYALAQNEFKVLKYPNADQCIEDVKKGVIHSCLIFSDDFQVGKSMKNEIAFYVDPSKANLVGTLLDTMSSRVSVQEAELSLNLTRILVDKLSAISGVVEQRRASLIDLATENEEASQVIAQTLTAVQRMSFNISITDADISNMSRSLSNLSSRVGTMEDIAEECIDSAYSYISDVDNRIDASNLSQSEKANLTASLVAALDSLEDLESDLNKTSYNASIDLAVLRSSSDKVITSLNTTRKNLQLATKDKEAVFVNLKAIEESLNKSIARVLELQNAFNQIDTHIRNIQIKEPGTIVDPVATTIVPVATERTRLNYIFPALILLIIMFTGILLPSTLIQMEKSSKAFFRNFMAPVTDIVSMLATLATSFLLLIAQLIIVLLIAAVFFSGYVFSGFVGTAIVFFLAIAVFVLIGMLVGYIFKSEETSLLASISISSIMLFLSDLILPIESMPSYIAFFADYNPFVIASAMLRKTMIFNLSLGDLSGDILLLLCYAILLFALVFLVLIVSKKQVVQQYIESIAPGIKDKFRKKVSRSK
jgi:ABC-type multidrug transport system permease subunit